MKRTVVWLPEADLELKEAWARYDGIRPELGQRFAEAVADAVERIATTPLNYAVIEKGRRRAGIHRFPYGLVVLVAERSRRRAASCCDRLFSWQARSEALARALREPGRCRYRR